MSDSEVKCDKPLAEEKPPSNGTHPLEEKPSLEEKLPLVGKLQLEEEPSVKNKPIAKLKKTKSVKFDSSIKDNELTSKRYTPSDLLLDCRRGSEGHFNKAAMDRAREKGVFRRASEPAISPMSPKSIVPVRSGRDNSHSEIETEFEKTSPTTKSGGSATMEGGLATYTSGPVVGTGSPDRGHRHSTKSSLHVEFAPGGEVKERKEKYLTAKYGAHQMSLIRKRLGVEMWMYDQLQTLYLNPKDGKSIDKEVDIDELLDLEDEKDRRKALLKKLSDCKQSSDKIEKFVDELLERAKTL